MLAGLLSLGSTTKSFHPLPLCNFLPTTLWLRSIFGLSAHPVVFHWDLEQNRICFSRQIREAIVMDFNGSVFFLSMAWQQVCPFCVTVNSWPFDFFTFQPWISTLNSPWHERGFGGFPESDDLWPLWGPSKIKKSVACLLGVPTWEASELRNSELNHFSSSLSFFLFPFFPLWNLAMIRDLGWAYHRYGNATRIEEACWGMGQLFGERKWVSLKAHESNWTSSEVHGKAVYEVPLPFVDSLINGVHSRRFHLAVFHCLFIIFINHTINKKRVEVSSETSWKSNLLSFLGEPEWVHRKQFSSSMNNVPRFIWIIVETMSLPNNYFLSQSQSQTPIDLSTLTYTQKWVRHCRKKYIGSELGSHEQSLSPFSVQWTLQHFSPKLTIWTRDMVHFAPILRPTHVVINNSKPIWEQDDLSFRTGLAKLRPKTKLGLQVQRENRHTPRGTRQKKGPEEHGTEHRRDQWTERS